MSKTRYTLAVLYQHLAIQNGFHLARDPRDYQHSAEIIGLTPSAIGYDRCAVILGVLRREAATATADDYTLTVVRDPRTHERLGYMVYARDREIVERLAKEIRELLP